VKSAVLSLAAALVAAACSSSGDRGAAPADGAPAGDVTEKRGDVRAIRAGASRALEVGGVVAADDVIKTGADGRVAILLRHNHVTWALGPGKEKKVSESAAWTAAAGAGSEVVTEDHSYAAGRDGERSAADTSATSGGGSASGSGMASGSGTASGSAKGQTGAGSGRASGSASTPHVDVAVAGTGEIKNEVVEAIVRRDLDRVTRCYQQQRATDPTAAGTLVVRILVGTDGKVLYANPLSSQVAGELASCIARAIAAETYPGTGSQWEKTITFTLSSR
jgi:hypothetical protein